MKPTLNLYLKWKVLGVEQDDSADWKWAILLGKDGKEARIVNKSRHETIAPIEIIGGVFHACSLSMRDTTLHFMMPNGFRQSVGLNPTQYAISDEAYGGEVYPQWPEALEEAGIPAHPEEDVSAKPNENWAEHRDELLHEQDIRHGNEAQEFLKEDEDDD